MFWDFFKGFVGRSEDSVVRCGSVEQLDQIRVFADQLGKFGGVFALGNQLVDRQIRLVVVPMVPVMAVVVVMAVLSVVLTVGDRCGEPGLCVECGLLKL